MKWMKRLWGIGRDDEEEEVRDSTASSSKDGMRMEEEEGEEGARPKYRRVDNKPSQQEVDEHMMTHIPFRSWCPHCIRGKKQSPATQEEGRI